MYTDKRSIDYAIDLLFMYIQNIRNYFSLGTHTGWFVSWFWLVQIINLCPHVILNACAWGGFCSRNSTLLPLSVVFLHAFCFQVTMLFAIALSCYDEKLTRASSEWTIEFINILPSKNTFRSLLPRPGLAAGHWGPNSRLSLLF